MGNNQVSIGKLNFEVVSDQAGDLRKAVDYYVDEIRETILPMISDQFDQYENTDQPIRLEQVNVELTTEKKVAWQGKISREIIREIEKKVEAAVASLVVEKSREDIQSGKKQHVEKKALSRLLRTDSEAAALQLLRCSDEEAIEKLSPLADAEVLKILTEILRELTNGVVRKLLIRSVLMAGIDRNLTKEKWAKTLTDQMLNNRSLLVGWREILVKSLSSESKNLVTEVWEQYHSEAAEIDLLVSLVAKKPSDSSSRRLIKLLLTSGKVSSFSRRWLLECLDSLKQHETPENWPNRLHSGPLNELLAEDAVKWELPDHVSQDVSKQLTELKAAIAAQSVKTNTIASIDPMSVENAGIVLIHPFLPMIFKQSGLLDKDNHWKDQNAQSKAAFLLHFLATGTAPTKEDDLALPKILTGIPVEEILRIEPDDKEFRFADQAMEEAILKIRSFWSPMSNISWEVLRRDFLSRTALLDGSFSEGYHLKVAPHALDILLNYKRWGLSMVRFSWMNSLLKIQWGKNDET